MKKLNVYLTFNWNHLHAIFRRGHLDRKELRSCVINYNFNAI